MDGSGSKTFALFHSNRCPHCRNFMPTWSKLVGLNSGIYNGIRLMDFEAALNPDIMDVNNIEAFPTLRYYPFGMKQYQYYIPYSGSDRSLDSLIAFLSSLD